METIYEAWSCAWLWLVGRVGVIDDTMGNERRIEQASKREDDAMRNFGERFGGECGMRDREDMTNETQCEINRPR